MRGIASRHLPARQRGVALLALLALVSVMVIFAYVTGLNRSAAGMAQARAQRTSIALAQAKEALIAYAVTYKDTHDDPGNSKYYVPGYLPCPDLGPASNPEGQAAGNCPLSGPTSLVSVMGRLPWKSLGLDALKDGSGECLWYAVSGTYKNSPNGVSGSTTNSNMMNWDTNGQFNVMDTNATTFLAGSLDETKADTRAVAVIFAPGAPLSGQNRTPVAGTSNCGGNFNAVPPSAAYLETATGINNSTLVPPSSPDPLVTDFNNFIAGTKSDTFNDQLVYITRADIWNAIKKRTDFQNNLRALTRRAAECTKMYGTMNIAGTSDMRLPWASNVSLSTTSVPTYAVDAKYNDTLALTSGRLSYKVNTAAKNTATNNRLPITYDSNSYIFTNSSYCSYTPEEEVWYENWKDQLFYAVASNYKPDASSSTQPCPTCLKINGIGNYAAVVIFAGDKLTDTASQVIKPRSSALDKGTVGSYLDGATNPDSITAHTGGDNYEAKAASDTFNDIVYAIDSNTLAVKCFSTNSSSANYLTMVPVPAVATAPPGNPKYYADCDPP